MENRTSKKTHRYIMSVIYCVFGLAINAILVIWNWNNVMWAIPIAATLILTTAVAIVLFIQNRSNPDYGIEAFYQLSVGFAIGSGITFMFVMYNIHPLFGLQFAFVAALPLLLHLCDLLIRACMKKELAGEMDGKLKVRLKDPIAALAFTVCVIVFALITAVIIELSVKRAVWNYVMLVFTVPLSAVPLVFFLVRKQIRDIAFLFGATGGLNAFLCYAPVFEDSFYVVDVAILGGMAQIVGFAISCFLAAVALALLIRQSARNSLARRELNAEKQHF